MLKGDFPATNVEQAPFRNVEFAVPRADVSMRGTDLILRNSLPLGPYAKTTFDYIQAGSLAYPDRICIAERAGSGWTSLTYAEVHANVDVLAQALLDFGIRRASVVAALSPNTISVALLQLAATSIGAIFAPISPSYASGRKNYDLLKGVLDLLNPTLVFISDHATFGEGLKAAGYARSRVIEGNAGLCGLTQSVAKADLNAARAQVHRDDAAKIMLTSGSTGLPKGVWNTHRMIASNQSAISTMWPFLRKQPPVTCCWLPWNHTMGGNFTFYMMLANGGSFYIDDGRPTADGIERTVENLAHVRPTIHYNVPRGLDMLLSSLERGEAGNSFFHRLDAICFSGSAMPAALWQRINQAAVRATGHRVHIVTSWGTTETAPAITLTCGDAPDSSFVGVPLPGVEVKLATMGDLLEGRVRGPNVTPGYVNNDVATESAFDEDGFYLTGDALKVAKRDERVAGVAYGGRVSENFKLSTGTWVHVGGLRVEVLTATSPLLQDCVIAGDGKDELGILAFLNVTGARQVIPDMTESIDEVARDPRLHALIVERIREMNSKHRNATREIRRVCIEIQPLDTEAGEITDKGYINQRAVLRHRGASVDALFAVDLDEVAVLVK